MSHFEMVYLNSKLWTFEVAHFVYFRSEMNYGDDMKLFSKSLTLAVLIISTAFLTACPDKKSNRSSDGNGFDGRRNYAYACPGDLTEAELQDCIDDYLDSTSESYGRYWNGVLSVTDKSDYRKYLRTLVQQPCDTDLSFNYPIDYDDCDVWDERIGIMVWSTTLSLSGEHYTSLWKLLDQNLVNQYQINVEQEFWIADDTYSAVLENTAIGINDDKISIIIEESNFVATDMDVTIRYQGKKFAEGKIYYVD